MTPEGRVKEQVKKRLHAHNVLPFTKAAARGVEPAGIYWMAVQGPFAVHGVHDFTGCWHGVFWSIETKAPENPEDETAAQGDFRVAVTKAGGIALTGVRDAAAVDHLYQLISERIRK
jgi:hypothetical protein